MPWSAVRLWALLFVPLLLVSAAPPSIADKTKGTEKRDGYFPFYWDEAQGKIWLEIPRFNQEFLYQTSLPAGLGSNDIGLDRGQLGGTHVVRFERSGNKVLLIESNYDYRARSESEAERRAVKQSFAESTLWGFKIEAEQKDRVLVDATDFLLRDAHGVAERLAQAKQGSYRLDGSRSAFYLDRTKNFPKNTEFEATLTWTGGPAGQWLRSVTPSPDAVTLREHHSFVELPGPGFEMREFDPRSGFYGQSFFDYATPVTDRVVKRYTARHRLQKKDPSAAISDPVKPIIYYLDPGAPEPIRSALLEGARWWNQAYEAAGYRNAFQVELLPEDADPMDVRYNVIQWVHRSTRGWSYGASVSDPRTGEIIKGHVTLGSLRVRQDFLIAEAFLSPYVLGQENPAMLAMSLDRIRQLAAHEVGHTLGLMHNYIASTRNRASVMDYPHPNIQLNAQGVPDLSDAYAKGIGEWDKVAIRWGYSDFAAGVDKKQALDQILKDAIQKDNLFLTDIDARPAGSSEPQTHLWDGGSNAADELSRMLQVRRKALDRFGESNIKPGEPMALLEDVLVPLYFSHRYQTEAAVKAVGGIRYRYALRGDGQTATEPVSATEQRRALTEVLKTLSPAELTLSERILRLIPPRPAGYEPTRELFQGRTWKNLDPEAAAESAAEMTLGLLLHPQRASRLEQLKARDAALPGLEEVLAKLDAATWGSPRLKGTEGAVQRAVELAELRQVMALSMANSASGQARAVASASVRGLKQRLTRLSGAAVTADASWRAHYAFAVSQIEQFEKDPSKLKLPEALEAPPGMPIGDEGQ